MGSPDLTCLVPAHRRLPDERCVGPATMLHSRLGEDAFAFAHGTDTLLYSPMMRSFAAASPRLLDLARCFDGSRDTAAILGAAGHPLEDLPIIAALARMGVLWSPEFGLIGAVPSGGATPVPGFTVMPTTACQLRCVYCYSNSADPKNGRTIDPRAFDTALDGFLATIFTFASKARLTFHGGGEPTLNFPLVRQLVQIFRERCEACWIEPSFQLTTNGTFSEEVCGFLIDHRFACNVSLDGPADLQDAQRPLRSGGGSFELAIRTIRRLVAAGLRVEIRATITAAGAGRMTEIVDLAAAEGVASVHFAMLKDTDRARATGSRAPDPDAYAEGYADACRRALDRHIAVAGEGAYCLAGPRNRYCGASGLNWILSAGGYVSTCTEVQDPSDPHAEQFMVGRVDAERGTLETFPGARERLMHRVVENLPGCANCWLKYSCAGDCPVQVLNSAGDMMKTGSPGCDLIRRMNADLVALLVHSNVTEIPFGARSAIAYERLQLNLQ